MTDLIKREDAIEAIKKEIQDFEVNYMHGEDDENYGHDIGFVAGLHTAKTFIRSLPSADAVSREEYEDIIKDYRKQYENMNNEIADLEAKLSAEAVQGWRIGKPTEQGKYIVTLDSFGHKHIDLFYYGKPMMPNRKVRGNCWYRSDDEWGDVVYDDKDVLAWMPLPMPYREDGEV